MARMALILVCDRGSVPIGLASWLAGVQFAFFSGSRTAGRTANREYFLGSRLPHARSDHAASPAVALVCIDHSGICPLIGER
jgi:hypothetical protein